MGGAVSSGESNDDLIDNLLEADYIKSPLVERVFRAVDRAFYYTEPYKQNAYKDLAWKDGNLHLSAPCIYSEVLENLNLQTGMCFLNIGSGTGYFSTMCGLILGKTGVNHGIELYPEVVNYARMKLDEFLTTSPAIDEFDFCLPEFTSGNCLESIPAPKRYDRIYCGAACPNNYVGHLIDMLKIGGICVVPLGDSLMQITRTEEKKDERKALLPVSFASLISPTPKESGSRTPVELPDWSPKCLTEICRSEIRCALRKTISMPEPMSMAEDNRKKKRKRRQERRRASRLVVVQRRRSGGDVDGENGFVAIAYSMGSNNSSDEDRNRELDPEQNQEAEAGPSGQSSEDSSRADDVAVQKSDQEDTDTVMGELNDDDDKVPTLGLNGAASSSTSTSETSTSRNGVAVITGSCNVYSASNTKKAETSNGDQSDNTRTVERRSTSASSSRGRPTINGNGRGLRSARTGAETLLGRIRELVRARQQDLESMRRQFRRSDSDAENNGRSRSANRDESSMSPSSINGNASNSVHSDLTTSSDSSPSPSVSATSTSDDETGAENQSDSSKKRCRNESSGDEKKRSGKEPKPDPLLVNPCSVQMRKKILDLPLPPALKVYLNYDRKIHY